MQSSEYSSYLKRRNTYQVVAELPIYSTPGFEMSKAPFLNASLNLVHKNKLILDCDNFSSLTPFDIELEVAQDENYKKIVLKKKWEDMHSCDDLSVDLNDRELFIFSKGEVCFRVRRKCSDGTYTKWCSYSEKMQIIDELSILKAFEEKEAEEEKKK